MRELSIVIAQSFEERTLGLAVGRRMRIETYHVVEVGRKTCSTPLITLSIALTDQPGGAVPPPLGARRASRGGSLGRKIPSGEPWPCAR